MIFTQRLYIQISPDRITLSTPDRWSVFDEPPLVAIDHANVRASIIAFGAHAQGLDDKPEVRVVNPFSHPRSIISDFTVADKLVGHAIRRVLQRRWLRPRVEAVIHPLGEFEGGLTQVEYRALRELGWVSGARKTAVHEGRPLTRAELMAFDFAENA